MTSSTDSPPRVEHLQPSGLVANPAFSHVVVVGGAARTIYVGGQNAVTANDHPAHRGRPGPPGLSGRDRRHRRRPLAFSHRLVTADADGPQPASVGPYAPLGPRPPESFTRLRGGREVLREAAVAEPRLERLTAQVQQAGPLAGAEVIGAAAGERQVAV